MNPKRKTKAPAAGEKILRCVLSGLDAESVVGDLQENYRDLAADKGVLYARTWFWLQIFRAFFSTLSLRAYWAGTMFKTHMKITWRNIRLQKTYSLINLAGLAVGMAVCIIILLWVQYESGYDRFHENLGDLHRLILRSEEGHWHDAVMVGLIPGALEAEYPEVVRASNLGRSENKLYHGRKALIGRGLRVNPGFLQMFTFPLLAGNPETALEAPDSIVLTEELAQKLIGDEEALGKVIWIDDQLSRKVSGVVRNIPENSSIQFEFLVPYMRRRSIADHWGWKDVREAYVLLRKGTAAQDLN
jgi:putative ABC transport system permease protein